MVDARKNRFEADAAWDLIHASESITTARGKKVQAWDPAADDREMIMKQVMGPSGNLRAPTLKIGSKTLVGFNPDLYESLVKGDI